MTARGNGTASSVIPTVNELYSGLMGVSPIRKRAQARERTARKQHAGKTKPVKHAKARYPQDNRGQRV